MPFSPKAHVQCYHNPWPKWICFSRFTWLQLCASINRITRDNENRFLCDSTIRKSWSTSIFIGSNSQKIESNHFRFNTIPCWLSLGHGWITVQLFWSIWKNGYGSKNIRTWQFQKEKISSTDRNRCCCSWSRYSWG